MTAPGAPLGLLENLGHDEENRRLAVLEGLRGWISETPGWDQFLTVTFRDAFASRKADVALESLSKYLRRRLPGVRGFVGAELHKSGDVHLHGILGTVVPVTRTRVWRDLHDRFGYARLVPVRSAASVSEYCTKYVTKSLAEWGIL